MIRSGLNCFALAAWLAFVPALHSAVTNAAPDFREVYQLVLSNLTGVTGADLDRAALNGLLAGMDGRVLLEDTPSAAATNQVLISRVGLLDKEVGYVRVNRVAEGLASELASAVRGLNSTNVLKGLVLDLRFAAGSDFAAAAAAADLFVVRERPLLDWGAGSARARSKADALTLPLAVLVNHDTAGAAEALAAVLREAGVGLLLGDTTAGRAMVMQEFTLKDGQRLRVATRLVKLGDGVELSVRGVAPDIRVAVDAADERAWFENPYVVPGQTNATAGAEPVVQESQRPRPSEADLVRERQEELNHSAPVQPPKPPPPPKQLIHDPVLARAVDLIKALALVREGRG